MTDIIDREIIKFIGKQIKANNGQFIPRPINDTEWVSPTGQRSNTFRDAMIQTMREYNDHVRKRIEQQEQVIEVVDKIKPKKEPKAEDDVTNAA